jgi:hypothetical protein
MDLPKLAPNTIQTLSLEHCSAVGSDTFLEFIAQQSISLRKIKMHSTEFIQEEDEDILGQMASTVEYLQELEYIVLISAPTRRRS